MRWLALIVLWVACGAPASSVSGPDRDGEAQAGAKYSEEFLLPTRDRREVSLTVRARIRVRPARRANVAAHGGEDWYWTRVRPQLRAVVQFEVQRRDVSDLRRNAGQIAAAVLERLRERYAGTPFEFVSVELVRVRERDGKR